MMKNTTTLATIVAAINAPAADGSASEYAHALNKAAGHTGPFGFGRISESAENWATYGIRTAGDLKNYYSQNAVDMAYYVDSITVS